MHTNVDLTYYSARVSFVDGKQYAMEWYNVSDLDFDFTHQIVATFAVHNNESWSDTAFSLDDILIGCPLPVLFGMYHMWRAGDLRRLAFAHNLHVPGRESAPDILERLDNHTCGRECSAVVVIFQTLRSLRPSKRVDNARARMSRLDLSATHSYMQVADEALRRSIIREWQSLMTSTEFDMKVCAPCGRRTPSKKTKTIDIDVIDLRLLQNPSLPAKVRPTTYDFELYDRALLHPKGLMNCWQRASIVLCFTCSRELIDNHRMPKLCLANWLYYGHAELPVAVRQAIHDSTPTERLLVARARASRISYRFTEMRNADRSGFEIGRAHV